MNDNQPVPGNDSALQEGATRERMLLETFVRAADTLVAGFDVVEMLEELAASCVQLLTVQSAGLMLSDQRGHLRVIASSSEAMQALELLELQTDEGPCLDCFRSRSLVAVPELADAADRWPRFAAAATAQGVGSVYAVPMRLRGDTIGAMNLFSAPGNPLSETHLRIGQALADVATIAILSHRVLERKSQLSEELQTALNSRISIEQAKGILAESAGIDMGAAFELLRTHARRQNLRLSDVAHSLATGELDPLSITGS